MPHAARRAAPDARRGDWQSPSRVAVASASRGSRAVAYHRRRAGADSLRFFFMQEKAAHLAALKAARDAEEAKARSAAQMRGSARHTAQHEPIRLAFRALLQPDRGARRAFATLLWLMRQRSDALHACAPWQACTFRPQRLTVVTPVRPASRAGGEAASVKGMDKFTARQAEARRLRAEAEAAAAAAEETLLTVRRKKH